MTSIQAPPRPKRPVELPPKRLVGGAALALALVLVLTYLDLPLWQGAAWGAAFGAVWSVRLSLGERAERLLSRLAFVLGPPLCFWLVECMNYNYNPWLDFSPVQIAMNLAWYYMIACALYLAVGRVKLSTGLAAGLFVLVGLANHYIIRFRGRTIFPGDLLTLRTAANVAGNYNYWPDRVQVLSLLALGLFCLLLWRLPHQKGRRMPRLRVVLPVAAACLVYVGIFFGTGFLDWAGIEPSLWTTRGNGFLLNFSVCLRYSSVAEPEGYTPQALEDIQTELGGTAAPTWGGTGSGGVRPVNVIAIMNESLSDLTTTFDLETNTDPMPFLHGLTENAVKGTAYASVFGGTTANSEYEFLTGNTMHFLPEGTVPFQMYVQAGDPNLGGQMKSLGYETIFMHPYLVSGWNRRAVYQDFGFDRALFQSDFTQTDTMRNYITDQTNYENLIRLYEEKEPGDPLFIFNVTMQNHSAYNVPWKGLEKSVWLTGALEGRFGTVDQYLSLVRESDGAFAYLVDYFSQVEEPTMILLFGDHQPQVATNFYTEILGGEVDALDTITAQKRQAVPFVLWANYDIPERQGLELSLNYLSALLTEEANLPQTPYQQFLGRLWQSVPAINALGLQDEAGAWYRAGTGLSPQAQSALLEYEMLQYNQLFDHEENRLTDFFTLPEQSGGAT